METKKWGQWKAACVIALMFLLAVCMGKTKAVEAASSVTSGAVELNGHYYKLYNKGLTWTKAKKYCEGMGGHLVTITSEEEQELVNGLLTSASRNSYWMGGYKNSNDVWCWITGEAFSYTNWASGEPNNCSNSGYEDVVMVYKNTNPLAYSELGEWNDLNRDGTCGNEEFFGLSNIGFICEWDSKGDAESIDLTEGTITLSETKIAYTGDAFEPSVTVKWNGIKLKKGTDYTVTYSNNTAIGKAKVTVKGKGNFEGKLTKTFKIVPPKVTSVKVTTNTKHQITVKWSKPSGGISGYELQYSTKSSFSSKSVKTISKSSKKVTLKNLTKGKKYYVRIRAYKTVNGTKYYGSWSTKKSIKVK